jgi:hypothetical protein
MSEAPLSLRPLNPAERLLLEHLLKAEISGIGELREQARHVLVRDDSGAPCDFGFHVPPDAAPPAPVKPQVPIHAHSIRHDEHGFDVTLWIDGDYLGSIEVSWYDTKPTRLPRPEELLPAERF